MHVDTRAHTYRHKLTRTHAHTPTRIHTRPSAHMDMLTITHKQSQTQEVNSHDILVCEEIIIPKIWPLKKTSPGRGKTKIAIYTNQDSHFPGTENGQYPKKEVEVPPFLSSSSPHCSGLSWRFFPPLFFAGTNERNEKSIVF